MYNARTMRHAMTEFSRAKALCSVPFAAAEPRTLTFACSASFFVECGSSNLKGVPS
jgi:hypothetical protein